MDQEREMLSDVSARRAKHWSRRNLLRTGAVVGAAATAISIPAIVKQVDAAPAQKPKNANNANDAKVLNGALFYEHQAIWAYSFAATKLTSTDVGKAVLAVALANQADHQKHRDTLVTVIKQLGGTPVAAQKQYDLSSYLKAGEGALDSDVNIAKLALALETDAAIAYGQEAAKLKTPALITAGASIGAVEASHATLIRSAFKALGVDLAVIPVPFISADTRSNWVLKV
ncbi:ferritin-like domain-containing protein [Leptolyngbya sp. FACHB-321]|uniref:ferritin-like domain-containing protein n=1 Tax=Leptolyngbya sp. FACHB-321 TaxID=2692807 RepID=UPI0016856EC8|nr:ferritin-like domain-containing protein [Leptolyngbya sp. FACHB-321]MBD2037587.1 ferritin-like domain-containing protein [Leptolyngbya sp. FACHB-321]